MKEARRTEESENSGPVSFMANNDPSSQRPQVSGSSLLESAGSKQISSAQVSEQEHLTMIDRFLNDLSHDKLAQDDLELPRESPIPHAADQKLRWAVRECDMKVETLRWIEYDLVTIIDRVRDDLKEIEFWRTASDEEVAFARRRVRGDKTAIGAGSPSRAKKSPQPKLAKNVDGAVEHEKEAKEEDANAHEEDKELSQMMRYGGASRIELQVQVAALKRQLHDESKARDEAERNAKRFKEELDRMMHAALNVEMPDSVEKFDEGKTESIADQNVRLKKEKDVLLKELAIARQLFKDAEYQLRKRNQEAVNDGRTISHLQEKVARLQQAIREKNAQVEEAAASQRAMSNAPSSTRSNMNPQLAKRLPSPSTGLSAGLRYRAERQQRRSLHSQGRRQTSAALGGLLLLSLECSKL
uniref:Uncharacterized protein n=1 Tax=Guillardia theta TaxID=55529 RepID=A0A7S4PR15_GUITH|mmetsp:Transcript_8624/g.28774  ORF Transcript_8624/g.28774 Transcript_8624/m.28774 type:complete len:414 (+) Transcript_8624:106-1347(+)